MSYFLDKPASANFNESREITSEVVIPSCSKAIASNSVPANRSRTLKVSEPLPTEKQIEKTVTRQQKRAISEEAEEATQQKKNQKRKKAQVHGKAIMINQPATKLSKKSKETDSVSDV
jgi:hypothetical protein